LEKATEHAAYAEETLVKVKSAKDAAEKVKETAFKLLLEDVADLSAENE
jgi:hypothetical protein